MGFDISGKNPKINVSEKSFVILTKYKMDNYDSWDDWCNAMKEDDVEEKYWEEYESYQDANPGIYFRNNVWWWRPLWDYVCDHCDCLEEKDYSKGWYNDGSFINKAKSKQIASTLRRLIKENHTSDYELAYEEFRKNKAESDDKEDSFKSNYPFCVENVRRFAKFCEESGGFYIC